MSHTKREKRSPLWADNIEFLVLMHVFWLKKVERSSLQPSVFSLMTWVITPPLASTARRTWPTSRSRRQR